MSTIRRSTGRICFIWLRTNSKSPARFAFWRRARFSRSSTPMLMGLRVGSSQRTFKSLRLSRQVLTPADAAVQHAVHRAAKVAAIQGESIHLSCAHGSSPR